MQASKDNFVFQTPLKNTWHAYLKKINKWILPSKRAFTAYEFGICLKLTTKILTDYAAGART